MPKKIVTLSKKELKKKSKERTIVLCKPESIVLGVYPEILNRIQKMYYKTPILKTFRFSEQSVREFYGPVIESWEPKESIEKIFDTMTKYPTLVTLVEGPNSIPAMRKLAGGLPQYKITDGEIKFEKYDAQFQPSMAPMGTVRGDYSPADIDIPDTSLIPVPNFMHASESEDEYKREFNVLSKYEHISKTDLNDYKRPEWKMLFGLG